MNENRYFVFYDGNIPVTVPLSGGKHYKHAANTAAQKIREAPLNERVPSIEVWDGSFPAASISSTGSVQYTADTNSEFVYIAEAMRNAWEERKDEQLQ